MKNKHFSSSSYIDMLLEILSNGDAEQYVGWICVGNMGNLAWILSVQVDFVMDFVMCKCGKLENGGEIHSVPFLVSDIGAECGSLKIFSSGTRNMLGWCEKFNWGVE